MHGSISELARWNGLSIGKSCVGWSRIAGSTSCASNSRASFPSACDLETGRGLVADGTSRKCGIGYAPDREDSHHDYSCIGERAAGPTAALFACAIGLRCSHSGCHRGYHWSEYKTSSTAPLPATSRRAIKQREPATLGIFCRRRSSSASHSLRLRHRSFQTELSLLRVGVTTTRPRHAAVPFRNFIPVVRGSARQRILPPCL